MLIMLVHFKRLKLVEVKLLSGNDKSRFYFCLFVSMIKKLGSMVAFYEPLLSNTLFSNY